MAKNFYSGTQAELATGAQNLIDIVTPAVADYGLTPAQLTSYTTLTTTYVDALALATEPATKTTVTVESKNTAKRALRSATIDIARIITATPTVTNAQLLALNLNPRVAPQPAPVPVDPPSVDIVAVIARLVKIRIHNNGLSAKAPGAIGANVYTYVGPVAPDDPAEYFFQGMSTRSLTEIEFPNTVPSGALVWVSCCWVGSRGQIGMGSTPRSFTLQGGQISAAA